MLYCTLLRNQSMSASTKFSSSPEKPLHDILLTLNNSKLDTSKYLSKSKYSRDTLDPNHRVYLSRDT